MPATTFCFELCPRLPEELKRLAELANDLTYSWDREIRGVFWRLDHELWNACDHNPKLFLQRVAQDRLEAAAADNDYLYDYHGALSSFDTYHAKKTSPTLAQYLDPVNDLVAYFCAEFGLHESLPIYSGGLGILAGDHCKAASDQCVPFVALGLLYRQGYFTQRIDGQGFQQAHYHPVNFDNLPITPACGEDGAELRVSVPIAERLTHLRLWRATVGHIKLILLDSDLAENSAADRSITYQLYGGDSDMRIQQEIVLGIGGVRALRALGFEPTVWHINEGHSAFQVLERVREHVAGGLPFDTALELTAAGTVFTSHTPVPAGHDVFNAAQMRHFFQRFMPDLQTEDRRFFALGADPHGDDRFNMTALAFRGSRYHNGVSRIHRNVVAEMESYVWPQIPSEENPVRHVTNGVHLHTFIARPWTRLFHDMFRGWRNQLLDTDYWRAIDSIPNHRFTSVRRQLKRDMLIKLRQRLQRQLRRNGVPEAIIARMTRHIADAASEDTRTLVIGFARRFATYKRASLIFSDSERLARLLNDPKRPAILIFAGKAHPKDEPGQELIRRIHGYAMRPEFLGRVIMVEGYDLNLSRDLVQGCDVWLNNPEYPLEASGTSGMKAGINGVVNVSVLDGWWAEGYSPGNGFAITPVGARYGAHARDEREAQELLDIFEYQVIPAYYGTDGCGFGPEWIRLSKNSMKSLIPRFNSARMVMDYVRDFYAPACRHARHLAENNAAAAHDLAQWKQRVRERWSDLCLEIVDRPPPRLQHGEKLPLRIRARLNGLRPQDLQVECLLGRLDADGEFRAERSIALDVPTQDEPALYKLDLEPLSGLQHYRIRAYPRHPALAHPFETGCMVWL